VPQLVHLSSIVPPLDGMHEWKSAKARNQTLFRSIMKLSTYNKPANQQSNWPIFNSLWKERELQRFVDQNLFDLSESCVKADDTLLNRICRSPLRSGKTQATLGDMF
jgi:hypothetical protein